MLVVVSYHYVRERYPGNGQGIIGITPALFARQLELLSQTGARFVAGADVVAAVEGTARLPERAILITFDDGLREHYEEALPVLDRMGIPGLFFVNTHPIARQCVSGVHQIHLLQAELGAAAFLKRLVEAAAGRGVALPAHLDAEKIARQYPWDGYEAGRLKYLLNFGLSREASGQLVERVFEETFPGREAALSRAFYLSREQVARMSERGLIGTHGWKHVPMGLMAPEVGAEMVERSVEDLERWTGIRPKTMSYPYGQRDAATPEVAAVARRVGIRAAFTTEIAGNDRLSLETGPFFLGRLDCNYVPGGKAAKWSVENLFETAPVTRGWGAAAGGGACPAVAAVPAAAGIIISSNSSNSSSNSMSREGAPSTR